jgi:hypothetical protein
MAEDDEWRYSVDEFPDAEVSENGDDRERDVVTGADVEAGPPDDREGEDEDEDDEGNVAGQVLGLDDRIEPGSPTLENAFFVLLGAVATVVFFMVVAGLV